MLRQEKKIAPLDGKPEILVVNLLKFSVEISALQEAVYIILQ